MLSILIPVHNYNVFPLVEILYHQCIKSNLLFEIICMDDCSATYNEENKLISNFENCSLIVNSQNLGRAGNLNALAKKARYDWILFLDCDVIPVYDTFITDYVKATDCCDIAYGGIAYQQERPDSTQLLRWVYGKEREALSLEKRKRKPYQSTLTSNILIKKPVFETICFDSDIREYGYEDLVFIQKTENLNYDIHQLDNPVYHINLESSADFIAKSQKALNNLKFLEEQDILKTGATKLSRTYQLLIKLRLASFFARLFNWSRRSAEKNLCSQNPSLFVFDCYKLGYFCLINLK